MAETESKGFSASEMRFIGAFFINMQTKPDVDWDKVAVDASLKDSRCARDRFRQILAKHGCPVGGAGTSSPRKAKKGTDEAGGSVLAKVTKRAPRKKTVKKAAEKKDDDDQAKVKGEVTDGAKYENSSDA